MASRRNLGATAQSGVLLYSRFDEGHRLAFVEQFGALLGGERTAARRIWFAREPVLFLMIEEAFLFYVAAALFRSVLGRRTTGFLFRPGPALKGTDPRLRVKRWLLAMLRRVPPVSTLTIIPFAVEPRFAALADGSIDDPQQWDLSDADLATTEALRSNPSALVQGIREAAGNRGVASAIGRQDTDKGFDLLVATYLASAELRDGWLFSVGGKVDPACRTAADTLVAVGGYLADRRVTDAEILELYAAADFVWCCYSAQYDQSSGVMGRAVQLGIPVIVREGSLLQRICETEGIAHVALRPGAVPELSTLKADPVRGRELRDKMKSRSLRVLQHALFGSAA